MLEDYFKQYLFFVCENNRTVNKYFSNIKKLNQYLLERNFVVNNVFQATLDELTLVKNFLENDPDFQRMNAKRHRDFSSAFNHFYRFACESGDFFRLKMNEMDTPIAIPKKVSGRLTTLSRSPIVVAHAIESAGYKCEINPNHTTFISKATGRAYMEAHHLIPIANQDKFEYSLDVYANVVCLCPICHRMLHFADIAERRVVAEKLFLQRAERLKKSGIDISLDKFLELILT